MKLSCEMSAVELAQACAESCGIPPPPRDAPMAVNYEWYVAAMFSAFVKHGGFETETAAHVAAANDILASPNWEHFAEPLQRALGRGLTQDETRGRRIDRI